jgi:TolB-like protein
VSTHTTPARLVALTGLALLLLLQPLHVFTQVRSGSRPRGESTRQTRATVRVAVLPFRNSLARRSSEDDASVLGYGIADSLTNALKSVAGLSVIDSEVALKAAARFEGAEVEAKDDDALRVAESLSAQVVVVGSFQLSMGHLHVDARLLTVDAEANAPARRMVADGTYPDGYSALIEKLTNAVLANLKLPLARMTADGGVAATRSPEAFRLYVQGTRKAGGGDAASLSEAIELFRKAIELDPTYADALAAKSEAETKLYDITKGSGENADALGRAAMNDASAAIKSAPLSGRGHRARSRAQTAQGDYVGATQSSREASKRWPGDVESVLARLRGRDGGLTRSPETDRFLLDHPELALTLRELPKVLVVNEGTLPVTISFIPDSGRPYPPVKVSAGAARIVPLFVGSYRILFECQLGSTEQREVLEAGLDYKLVFDDHLIPAGAFVFVNGGDSQVQVSVSGPLRTSLALRPRETKRLRVPPGDYSVTGHVGSATTSARYDVRVGDEETVTYTYTAGRIPIFSPARLTISNAGNSALTVTISGPRRLSISVPPGGKTITLPAGTYTIRVACGSDVSEAEEYELSPGEETVIDGYSCNIRYIRR